ncbi:hypothetical protein VNO78_07195 [Psophocarpus tetragonolobus]|uniref:Gnk2-homologous domain-containing protein n=1 Tax=Psophocarpus tetragonolobus TaxID=3891 RepID=A0AAN9XRX7_PSOTE
MVNTGLIPPRDHHCTVESLIGVNGFDASIIHQIQSFRPLVMKAQTRIYVGSNCQNNPQQSLSSAYETNLKRLLEWATSDSATSKGYNSTRIGNKSPVYGHYDCRGDVGGYFCQFCVSNAAREVPRRCPNRVSAMVWYDYCILKYSNESFFGKILTNQSWLFLGTKNISNKAEIRKDEDFVRYLIRKATKETNQLYYMDYFNLSFTQRRYGMVQCCRDLTNEGCRQCLEAMLAQVSKCCGQKIGWFIWSGTCMIRYDDEMFYLLNNQTSSLPVPNMQTDWFHLSSFHKIQTEETWTTDLPKVPLAAILQSTDNFSEAFKLGEGGFDSDYKVGVTSVVVAIMIDRTMGLAMDCGGSDYDRW